MSTTEMIAEPELKLIQPEKTEKIAETIGIESRTHEMLLVLNEVFDSLHSYSKS